MTPDEQPVEFGLANDLRKAGWQTVVMARSAGLGAYSVEIVAIKDGRKLYLRPGRSPGPLSDREKQDMAIQHPPWPIRFRRWFAQGPAALRKLAAQKLVKLAGRLEGGTGKQQQRLTEGD
jgi:hypothetical protein